MVIHDLLTTPSLYSVKGNEGGSLERNSERNQSQKGRKFVTAYSTQNWWPGDAAPAATLVEE